MMNKRTIIILALVAALALPSAALAKAEFSLGGFIKLQAFWDSTQEGKNMNTAVPINNANLTHHGRLKFTSQGSRFNFTIKGPKVWGANTTGFIEMDFDEQADATAGTNAAGASNGYIPRLRHAMFRFDWPETQLLMGQYWSLFSQWYPELGQDGPFQMTGTPTARLAQIRLTQKFLGMWQVTALVGESNFINQGETYSANDRNGGESPEAPQVQAQIQFQKDLYGKAAWYGKPTGFTAQLTAGWQRGITFENQGLRVTGENAMANIAGTWTRHQYQDPWLLMGALFIPVIPTHSANLAGTASLQTTWWIGQSVESFGFGNFGSEVWRFQGIDAFGRDVYEANLTNRFGGQVSAQYYFTNQWFLTGAWGFSRAFGLGAFETDANATSGKSNAFAANSNPVDYHQEFDICLWYRPVSAFKFSLQYAYARTNYIQQTLTQSWKTNVGEAHRVQFVGLFFF
jgi:hypothetical protein